MLWAIASRRARGSPRGARRSERGRASRAGQGERPALPSISRQRGWPERHACLRGLRGQGLVAAGMDACMAGYHCGVALGCRGTGGLQTRRGSRRHRPVCPRFRPLSNSSRCSRRSSGSRPGALRLPASRCACRTGGHLPQEQSICTGLPDTCQALEQSMCACLPDTCHALATEPQGIA